MRLRTHLILALLLVGAVALPHVAQAGIPFFGPIVPTSINRCAAGWGMLVTVLNNVIQFILTILIVFFAPLMIAYAGFLFVVNPTSAGGISKAKDVLTNTIVGIVVALAAWMIIDAVMAALYNPRAVGSTWTQLVSGGGDACLIQEGAMNSLNQADLNSGSVVTGVDASGGKFLSLPTNPKCTPSTILQNAAAGGYTLSQAQAETLSCISVAESSCGTNTSGATQVNGTPTSASGMFQIVFGCTQCNDQCHNLNIQACSQAAGVSGNLDCYSAFKGGLPAPGKEAQAAACKAAAANPICNTAAAACLLRANGGYSAWTADPRASTQKNCVSQYAGG